MAGSRTLYTGQMDYINTPSDDDLHGIAHRAAFRSRMPLGGADDIQELKRNRTEMEISRLSGELTKALNEILDNVRADAQLKEKLLDESSIFEKAMLHFEAAFDGAWGSIEGIGEVLFDTALFITKRANPFTGPMALREDLKNMKSFVQMSRDKIVDLDITDEDLMLYYQIVRDGQVFDQLLDFSKAYVKSLSSVDQVRLAASLLPDLLLMFFTSGISLAISGSSKARHLQKIQTILRKLGSALRNALHRRKTQRRNFGGGPDEGSGGNSLSSPSPSAAGNKLSPPARRRRSEPDNTQDTVDVNDDIIDDGVKNADDEYITVYRGDRPNTKIIKSKASSEYGYKGAQDVIDNNDLDDLFKLHKESSDIPPSPFISTTSDKKVADFFAGKDGVVNEFRIPKNRATFNKHNDFVVPAGTKGESIPESEYLVPLYIKPSEFIKKGGGND